MCYHKRIRTANIVHVDATITSHDTVKRHPLFRALWSAVLFIPFIATAQSATDTSTIPVDDAVRQRHTVHVSPHRVIFDATRRTATLQFSNAGDTPAQAAVHVVFAYTDWPHGVAAETTLFTRHWEQLYARDTIVLVPRPTDPYAGRWITGLPATIALKPHETRNVSIQMTPPPGLRTGTYWARIITEVNPPSTRNTGKPKDTRTIYKLPMHGQSLPTLRDSAIVFYRQGYPTLGVRFGPVVAKIDTLDLPSPGYVGGTGARKLWRRMALHLTGTEPFEGVMSVTYHNLATGEDIALNPGTFILYRDGVAHYWGQADMLKPGRYQLIIRLESPQTDVPPAQRVPMIPVVDTTVFEVPQ